VRRIFDPLRAARGLANVRPPLSLGSRAARRGRLPVHRVPGGRTVGGSGRVGRWRCLWAGGLIVGAVDVLIVLFLILLNGLFAMTEIAVVSSNRFRLQQRAQAGSAAAARALSLAEDPNRFLSTIQIGITLVGVFNGAFGGATLAAPLAERLAAVPLLAPYSDALALGLVVLVITYLSLVVGELVPKRMALANPEGIAMALGGLMQVLAKVTAPIVWLLGASTNALLWLLRVRTDEDETISEAEIDMVIAQGREAGVIEPAEQAIIENAFWLGERPVKAIMTPRPDVVWLDVDATPEVLLETTRAKPHGRYLVAAGGLDSLLGFVTTADLLHSSLSPAPIDLRALVREPLLVPETMAILTLLERFRSERTHVAAVIDEYGGFEGLVTLSDILEELVGEVPSPHAEAPEVVALSESEWRVDGVTHVDELFELLGLEGQAEPDSGYQTTGGLVTARLGRVPQAGDGFEWQGFAWRVEAMDGHRVAWVRVERVDGGEAAPGEP